MATTIETPNTNEPCTYCGQQIFHHDPICVRDCTDDCGSPSFYCNYACLYAHLEESDLMTGDACVWEPEWDSSSEE